MADGIFDSIKLPKPPSSLFNLSHSNKLTGNFGYLYPFFYEDTLPGDHWRMSSSVIVRMPAMLAPLMHDVDICLNFFQVPYRLLWANWDRMVSGGRDGQLELSIPHFHVTNAIQASFFKNGSLGDYLGVSNFGDLGSDAKLDIKINAMPFLAYYLVWSQYFRDANLQASEEVDGDPLLNGVDGELFSHNKSHFLYLHKACWGKDYFTSSLPFAQRGDSVEIPLDFEDQSLMVRRQNLSNPSFDRWRYVNGTDVRIPFTKTLDHALTLGLDSNNQSHAGLTQDVVSRMIDGVEYQGLTPDKQLVYDPNGALVADLPAYAAADINDLRQAAALQRWLETSARGGSRYIEQIYAHYGIRSSDARLQRAQYLGGYRVPVQVSDVMQTSQTTNDAVLGDYAGRGVAAGSTHSISAYCEEFGCVIGVACIRPKTGYMQGIRRNLLKLDKYDYYWPEFANLGEQQIYNAEIYAASALANAPDGEGPLDTFGYTPRFAEYKSHANEVHGDFKSSLDYWHLARKFSDLPKLNSQFVECDGSNRIFSVEDPKVHHFYMEFYNRVNARRRMPYHGIPTLM